MIKLDNVEMVQVAKDIVSSQNELGCLGKKVMSVCSPVLVEAEEVTIGIQKTYYVLEAQRAKAMKAMMDPKKELMFAVIDLLDKAKETADDDIYDLAQDIQDMVMDIAVEQGLAKESEA